MASSSKEIAKSLLGHVPFTAELYWLLRQQGKPLKSRFSLKQLNAHIPDLVAAVEERRKTAEPGKKVFLFATLHYWIEHAALLGLTFASQGHDVTLGYLPYADWQTPVNKFDLRRQNAYAKSLFEQVVPVMKAVSFYNRRVMQRGLPAEVRKAVEEVTVYDTQYTLQVEEVEPEMEVYQMRLERNIEAARAALVWLKNQRPDVVIVPNGTIQELGVIYRVARYLNIPVTTYEFGDERQHIWLAQNAEVMQQETDSVWEAKKDIELSNPQFERIHSLVGARQRGAVWENFVRQWQDLPTQGGDRVRAELGLDDRPVVLLATNVLGDSLTLGRQLFSRNMAEWISRTVQYFAGREDAQLIIRVHPGEVLTHGVSMSDVVHSVLPQLPEHIRLIRPQEKLNTYDIVEVADLGLVYSTTVGLEMAMTGYPVVVAGKTHYRGRGFTFDPDSWVSYYKLIGQVLSDPKAYRLTQEQMKLAWKYAYHFFFTFPRPFPWHLVRVWEDYDGLSLDDVFSPENWEKYENTFRAMLGEPIAWTSVEADTAD